MADLILADLPGPIPPASAIGKRIVWTGTGYGVEDSTIANMPDAGQANGPATLNASGKVSQDPATARTSPIAGGLPKAGTDSRIAPGWIPIAQSFTQGPQTIPTDAYALQFRALKITGADALAIEGTGELVVFDLAVSASLALTGRG